MLLNVTPSLSLECEGVSDKFRVLDPVEIEMLQIGS